MSSGGSPPKPWDNGSGDYDALHSSMPTTTSTSHLPVTTEQTFSNVGVMPGNYSNTYGSTYNGAYGNGYRNYGSGYSLGGSSFYRQPYGSSYSRGYGSLMGGGYGGGYGGSYGGNYGGPANPQQPGNFYTRAQQSAQPTFDNIMQVVDAFTAFTNLMDSTLMAVMTSFHSVLQVVDMFSKMPHIFADSSLFRLLKFLWRRIVNFMLRRNSLQDTWDQNFSSQSSKGGIKWPLLLFLAIVIGGPCFVYSLLDPNQDK